LFIMPVAMRVSTHYSSSYLATHYLT